MHNLVKVIKDVFLLLITFYLVMVCFFFPFRFSIPMGWLEMLHSYTGMGSRSQKTHMT